MFFIDKLNLHQDHSASELPIVGRQMIARMDLATGKKSIGPNQKFHEGSYSSVVTVRCDGNRVEVSGNPSRFNRIENLFGFMSFDECVSVYNKVLSHFDLPPFTRCTKYFYINGTDDTILVESDGAYIDHVDFTKNHYVGAGSEVPFLKALSGQTIGKGMHPFLYPNQQTVDWYKGSKRKYKKVYIKSFDLKKHQKKRCKDATDRDCDYYQKVIDYCDSKGVVREEHSFKRDWLAEKKMRFYGLTKENDFEPHLKDIENIMKKFEVVETRLETVSDKLIKTGVCKARQSANATNSVFEMWRQDRLVVGENISRSQFYEHKRRLKAIGYDIAIKHDITTLPLPIVSQNVVKVCDLEVPDWYKKPSHLSLVG